MNCKRGDIELERDSLEVYLQKQIATFIGINASQLDRQQSLKYLGIDSLIAAKLRNRLKKDLAVDIPAVQFMEDVSLANFATLIVQQINRAKTNGPSHTVELSDQSYVSDQDKSRLEPSLSYPLSYGQQGLWFLYKLAPDSAAYNIAFTARIRSEVKVTALQRAFRALIDRHPTLRTTFAQQDGEPLQTIHASDKLWSDDLYSRFHGNQAQENLPQENLPLPLAGEHPYTELVRKPLYTQDFEKCFQQVDASDWNREELYQHVTEAYRHPFNLEQGPVLRLNLFTCAARDHVLLLTIHHIVVDGFSFGILLAELRSLYQAEVTGQLFPLPPLKRSYQDFVQWQQRLLANADGDRLWQYWQQQLSGELPLLKLPIDKPRPSVQGDRGSSYTFEIPYELIVKLRQIGKTSGATLYMVLLTIFQILLHRYTGQEDIIVGSPTEGRSEAEFAATVGFFVNMLTLRTNFAGNPTFIELLDQVRQTVIAALTHQDYPSSLLIERLQIKRDVSTPGLFRASFNLLQLQELGEDYALSVSPQSKVREDWGGLRLEPFVIAQQEGQNDLVFDVFELSESLLGIFRYSTDLFEEATIRRMAGHFLVLLETIVTNPEQAIAFLPLLTGAEQQQLLWEWNQSPVISDSGKLANRSSDQLANQSSNQCFQELFQAQVARKLQAIAVTFQGRQLTYEVLNTKANQLAHYLQKQGVKPDVLVGICVVRSLETVIAVLAVLKAGGAYLPLDPDYPNDRLSYMLADAKVSVLLTQESVVRSRPTSWLESLSGQQVTIVLLDKDQQTIAQEKETNLANTVTLNNLAYVIYTSGSTGKSKGVMVTHRSVMNAYNAWQDAYHLHTLTSHLQMANFCFDVFTGDLIRTLGSGSKLVLCPREWLLEPDQLYRLMRQEQVDTAEFVPTVLRNLVQYLEQTQQDLQFMRLLIVGSDTVYLQDWQMFQWFCGSDTRLINSYGVTEATIDSTYFEWTRGPVTSTLSRESVVPIGKPFVNIQTYVLDRHLQPVPVGVPGELHIGGEGLARGYLNRLELTVQKFIPLPNSLSFSVSEGLCDRVYKTGDLVRYRSDGNLEFLGRIDHQVKVRGFRIEVEEIEAVLGSHPQIQETVVMARGEAENTYLVAYFVTLQHVPALIPDSTPDPAPDLRELRHFLKQQLPEYMIPATFVQLEALPLTPNDKVDRRALPEPDWSQNRQTEFVPPQTQTQETIAHIFATILGHEQVGREQVGLYDNFFELGGHSLLATQVVSRLQQTFNLPFPLRYLLESPTIEGIDRILSEQFQNKSPDVQDALVSLPTIVPAPSERYQPFPLTDIQQAYWLGRSGAFDLGNIAAHGYLEIEAQNLDLARLNQAWQKLIERHDMLRVVVLPEGQQNVLEHVPTYPIEVLDLRGQPSDAVTIALEEIRDRMSHEVLAADRWPLFQICATHLDNDRTRLHLSFDALTADALSMFILGREWSQLYQDLACELPPLHLSFRDYVLAELALRGTPLHEQSQTYWFDRLDTLPPGPELPLAKNPASITHPQFHRRNAQLSATEWKQLKDRANQANLTPSGVLLTAFAEVLSQWSKSPKFTINLTLFQRLPLHPQVNHLVGDFTSLTLLEVDHSGSDSFMVCAQALQRQLWQDLDHGYISGLQVQRALSRRRESYQFMPIVFTSTLGLDTLAGNTSLFGDLGELVYSISQTPQVWLDHQIREQNGALQFNWDAIEALFPTNLLDDMFTAYCSLLEQLATSASAWVQPRRSLVPETQLQTRSRINTTTGPISRQTLHGLFLDRANLQPQAPAIIAPNRTLSYQELAQRAKQLAKQLRSSGATANTLVAVVMEKGWEQVVAVLGVLISGAAYLPIDPELPQERQGYLLSQADLKLVVTQPQLKSKLSWPETLQLLQVDERVFDERLFLQANETLCDERLFDQSLTFDQEWIKSLELQSNHDLAYVIYTSGSTGNPKGVAIDHRGAVNTILDINQRFSIGPDDRILALSALNFDLSVYDIFGILAAGGTIVLPKVDATRDPQQWLRLIVQEKVTLWNSVPALMKMFVEYVSSQPQITLSSLRLILLSGDWLPVRLPQQIQRLCPQVQIVGLGGATEASIWSICYPIETVNSDWKSIPYGKPLINQQVYLLNHLMEPSPVWVPGHLYIGGIGLSLGYWKDDEKTQASFITHPITQERLYKTGDLGRYLPDGNIEFLGREDFQVKLNGHRIELGEIEATLKQRSDVKDAIVLAAGEGQERQKLVAYVVSESIESQGQNVAEAYQPDQKEGTLTDSIERMEFKLKQQGLQHFDSSHTTIELAKPEFDQALHQAYLERQSYRKFLSEPLALKQLSSLLSCLQQMQLEGYPLPKYRYPSAGSLYPVQTYLWIRPDRVQGLETGLYYYHPAKHHLVFLSPKSEIKGNLYAENEIIFEQAAFSIILVGKLSAIAPLYGELSRDFCLLEAGHMGQLLMTNAPKQEMGLCPIGYLEFSTLQDLLNLESDQIFLYSFIGGKIDMAQTQQWLKPEISQSDMRSIPVRLQEYLQQKLPQYMIPSQYILLDKLPLTTNGKIDRKALPAPALVLDLDVSLTLPATEIEETITDIIRELLGQEMVGVDQNFFQLGMDSLRLVQLRNQLEIQLNVKISMRQLLTEVTNIKELATAVEEQKIVTKLQSSVSPEVTGNLEVIEL